MGSASDFYYSPKYEDAEYEYRHVHVTKEVAKMVPKNRLMSESEWRSLGIQQSPGWIHYVWVVFVRTHVHDNNVSLQMIHSPERHILLFRRSKTSTISSVAQTKLNELQSKLAGVIH